MNSFAQSFALALFLALLIVAIAYVAFMIVTARPRRAALERLILGQIAAAVRLRLPLATSLQLASRAERWRGRSRLEAISQVLARGCTLGEAVRLGFPECPGIVLSLIVAGEHARQLPAALAQAERMLMERDRIRKSPLPPFAPYAVVMLVVILVILIFIAVNIAPKFADIFADFGARPDAFFIVLVSSMADAVRVLLVLTVLALPAVLYLQLRPRTPVRLGMISRVADWIRWHVPGVRRVQFGEGMAAMLGAVRFTTASGMELSKAAELAAELDANWHLRLRMAAFARRIENGEGARQAARLCGLGDIAGVALASGSRGGDLDASLRFAADYHDAILSRWRLALAGLGWPICTLFMASIVALVVLGLFTPMFALLQAVIDSVGM